MKNKIEKLGCALRGAIIGALIIIALNSAGHVITVQVFPSMLPMIEGAP